jgi:hypothetical protein
VGAAGVEDGVGGVSFGFVFVAPGPVVVSAAGALDAWVVGALETAGIASVEAGDASGDDEPFVGPTGGVVVLDVDWFAPVVTADGVGESLHFSDAHPTTNATSKNLKSV